MKKAVLLVAVFLVVAAGAAAISSEPVYLKGVDHGKTVLLAIADVRADMKAVKPDQETQKALAKLEPALSALQRKCEAVKDKPLDVTKEYGEVAAAGKTIEGLAREHLLLGTLSKRVQDLLQKTVSPGK